STPLEEALQLLAAVARCFSATIVERGAGHRQLANVGPTLDELAIRLTSGVLTAHGPFWIRDAAAPNALVRASRHVGLALLPVGEGEDGAPRLLVLLRDETGDWPLDLRSTVEAFVPLLTS